MRKAGTIIFVFAILFASTAILASHFQADSPTDVALALMHGYAGQDSGLLNQAFCQPVLAQLVLSAHREPSLKIESLQIETVRHSADQVSVNVVGVAVPPVSSTPESFHWVLDLKRPRGAWCVESISAP
jgi:hypothetical protein